MIGKIFQVAKREFSSTVMTKAFLIGAFVIPGIFALLMPKVVQMMEQARAPQLRGVVAILDASGEVAERAEEALSPEGLSQVVLESSAEARAAIAAQMGPEVAGRISEPAVQAAIVNAFGPIPELSVEHLDPQTDLEQVRDRLRPAEADSGGLVALATIAPDAIERAEGQAAYGGFELQVRAKTDDRHIGLIRSALRDAIRAARYERAGMQAADLEALTTVVSGQTQEITDSGEVRRATSELNVLLPFGFMILLLMSVMVGGQYLLTTTIEEKSSRVVEVLLSAVSPMQLMTGKILGQMAVGVVLLSVYMGVGMAALSAFSLLDLISPMTIAYVIIYFVLAYFIIASLMAAIGASVNELREAQSLMGPVMMVLMLPYIFGFPISRDPNSTLAFVLSMVPPMSPFAMVIRITSNEPIPAWQIALSLALTAFAAYVCVWFAAKVFRIGLLMYGKPPNLKTLIRWVRMA
jgi:ABC-2 type transport system permease protein